MSGRLILVTTVGTASGSRAAAAALACAGSEPDRPGLLIDVDGRPPRPTLVASAGARELEERLAVHLPALRASSRGQICHVGVGGDPDDFEGVRAALSLVRDSVAVVHLPPALFRDALTTSGIRASGVLLRADLATGRALTALATRELIDRGLDVRVLKRPLAWIQARRALFGVLPAAAPGGLPFRLVESLLESQNPPEHRCYSEEDDTEPDSEGASQQQRRGDAGTRCWRGLHRDKKREARR